MNMKKIIPLSFAAMSVMGAFTACSDNKVVGADEQANTMAELSSSSVESGSSSSSIEPGSNTDIDIAARLKAIYRPNLAAAVIVSNEKVIEDTINAHETFEKAIQSIIDDDSYKATIADTAEWKKFEDFDGKTSYYKMDDVNAMVDENGIVHGPLHRYVHAYPPEGRAHKYIGCSSSGSLVSPSNYQMSASDEERWSVFESTDSVALEQFRQDCAAENGVMQEGVGAGKYGDIAFSFTGIGCSIFKSPGDTTRVDRDPYWKKYATIIVEKCVAPLGDGE